MSHRRARELLLPWGPDVATAGWQWAAGAIELVDDQLRRQAATLLRVNRPFADLR